MKVKAAVCRKFDAPMPIEELVLDDPHEHEVLVRFLATGWCHSDLSHWLGNFEMPLPTIIGHETSGVVEKVGPGVTKVKPGDRVIGCWMVPCGKCFQCLRGRPNCCEGTIDFLRGGVLLDGTSRFKDKKGNIVYMDGFISGFSSHTVMPEISAIRVPDHIKLPPEELCLLGCSVLTGWGTIVKASDASEGTSVGIWGCGGIGLNAVRAAAVRNCYPIVAVDLEESKRKIAMEFGATHFIDSSKNDPIPIIQEITGGHGLEYAMDATGDPGAQVQAWWALRMCGVLLATGLTPAKSTTNIPLCFGPLQQKSIKGVLYGNCHPTEDIPVFMELMAKGILKTDKLISETIKIEQLDEARRAMEAREIIGRWVIKW
jgi:S-(hydroxymethyl)glutathione dehydrogenase/alcohol dehydrogenase